MIKFAICQMKETSCSFANLASEMRESDDATIKLDNKHKHRIQGAMGLLPSNAGKICCRKLA